MKSNYIEQHIYGSARLGMRKPDLLLAKSDGDVKTDLTMSSRTLGEKRYELTNHLGKSKDIKTLDFDDLKKTIQKANNDLKARTK